MEVIEKQSESNQVRAGINEKVFFQRMGHLFESSLSVLGELMQNSRRAGATRIDITVDEENKSLSIQDNGHGIENFGTLIRLCDSQWSENIVLEDKPFGMGLFSVFYAGDSVDFLSNGKSLSMCLDDIENKRLLDVTRDDDAPNVGALVRINWLKETFFNRSSFTRNRPAVLYELERLSLGFPIPVFVNGEEVYRPHALDKMNFAPSDIGLVSIEGIHRGDKLQGDVDSCVCYLQGLPIGKRCDAYSPETFSHPIVHLDSVIFTAKMPDRATLFDAKTQLEIIHKSLKNSIKQFLIQQKAVLSPKDMVLRHWDHCFTYDIFHLFNDIPFIPAKALCSVNEVKCDTEGTEVITTSSTICGEELISRKSILDGSLVVWRDTPTDTNDEPWDIVCLKVMQNHAIFGVESYLGKNHWLNDLTPSALDFIYKTEIAGSSDNSELFSWSNNITIKLCDLITIHISSEVDDSFHKSYSLKNDWVLIPTFANGEFTDDYEAFVCRNDQSDDTPVLAIERCTDEWDVVDDSVVEDACKQWNQLVSNLKGAHLAQIVENAFPDFGVSFSDDHLSHLGVCIVETFENWPHRRALKVKPVDKEVLKELSDILGDVTIERLQAAFTKVFKPGEAAAT